MASIGVGETEGRLAARLSAAKRSHLRHRCRINCLASNRATAHTTITEREEPNQLDKNEQLGPINSHHRQGDNLRMALEERGGCEVRARICANLSQQRRETTQAACGRAQRVGGLAHEPIESSREERQTSGAGRRGCCVNTSEHRHRRRASGRGNVLTRSLVAHRVILATSLSFLLLLCLLAQHQQHVAAIKLPSFLASWIPQQQQQQAPVQAQQQVSAAGRLQDLVAAPDLSGDHSSNLLAFAPVGGHHQDNGASPKVKLPSSPLKRPFGGIGKHPIGGGGHHLFSALPKSLFGRILSGGGGQQQQAQPQTGAILSPMTRQQQQQLVLAIMANSQKYQAANQGPAGQPSKMWPYGAPAAAPSSGNYSQHASMQMHANSFINGHKQAHQFAMPGQEGAPLAVNNLMQHQSHPIASFRPIAQVAASEPAKKHALGYGESDEDFVIVNADQVPDLQRPPAVMQQQQQQRPLAVATVPTRHPSEEYREMPAIVIADPDDETVANLGSPVTANQTTNATTSGDREQVAAEPHPLSSQNNVTTAIGFTNSVNQTAPDVTPAPAQGAATNSTISKPPGEEPNQLTASSFESQHHHNGSSGAADSPESNRQESVASAVIVAASTDAAQPQQPQLHPQHHQQQEPEVLESFVLGPYKGLGLGDEELASPSSHAFQTQMESFIDHQQAQFSFPSYHMQQQQQQVRVHEQPQQARHHNNQHQLQHSKFGPPHSNGPQNLLGSASNLLQQARQLIQLPFTHLPHNAHLHQQPQHHSAQYRRPRLMHRPQQHWPAPMFGMPQQPQQQLINVNPNFQQPQQVSAPVGSQQVHHAPNGGYGEFVPSHNQRPPSPFFEGQNLNQARPAPAPGNFRANHQGTNFNLVVNHGAQMGQPSSAYFVDSTHQQTMNAPLQLGQDSYRQHQLAAAELNANETGGEQRARPAHFAQQMTQTSGRHKSGLYQIEPPKLESGSDKSTLEQQQQQLVAASEDDDDGDGDSAQQQQQKIDVQESASDEELGGAGGPDEEDEQRQDISQQQRLENEHRGEQQHQSQQMIAVIEPADQQRPGAANFSQQPHHQMAPPPNQTLQVGASFGVAPNVTTATQSQQVAVHEGRRGHVFNESLGSQQFPGQQQSVGQPDHDITTAYEFGQQQAAPERQPNNYLDTQVYTLPYTMTVQNQVASFAPQQQPRHFRPGPIPAKSYAPQRAVLQQQQQQRMLPVTFIRTGEMAASPRQQPLPVPVAPVWANNNNNRQPQYFHHYQPAVDQTSGVFATSAPQQFAFAVQHHPSQLVAQTPRQQQVVASAAPSVEQQDAVSVGPATSNSDQLASSSTTTPSSRVDDSGLDSQQTARELANSLAQQQQQQQQHANQLADSGERQEPQDRKSPPSSGGQPKQAAPRSPSSFCAGRASGLYADVEQRCKAYYQCAPTGHQMFQCNNQTQFNQKTQNCDWWYNVDCGGRLGSPEDFEQASPSSPRSQLAAMDQESATPTSASSTPPLSPSAQSDLAANVQQQQQSTQADLRSFAEPPASLGSTLAYDTPPPQATTTTQMNVPNATTQPSQQQQQQLFEAQATTTASTADERTLSSLQQFSERSSAAPTQGASAGARIPSEQKQQRQSDESDQLTGAPTTASSNQQLIEVANSGQPDDEPAQPRVGSSPNDDTPASTSRATPTTQQTLTTTVTDTPSTTTSGDSGRQATEEQAQNEVTTRREQQQRSEPEGQISQVAVAASGKPSARRFIQSEFGGSTKTARAISHQRKFKEQQPINTGDLLAVDAALPGASQLHDEMSQLHAQVEEHHSVRLGSAADVGGAQMTEGSQPESQQQRQQIYSTSANQGSVSYDPQADVREQQTIDLLGQFPPPARIGLVSSRLASELPQQEQSIVRQPVDEQKSTRTLERRFGTRLQATPRKT